MLKRLIIKILYFIQAMLSKEDGLCPYCQNNNYQIVYRKCHVIKICKCFNCGLFWTSPIFRCYKLYDFLYKGPGMTTIYPKNLEEIKSSFFIATDKDFSYIFNLFEVISIGKKILEFGSSWGYFLFEAKQRGFDAVGVEISEKRRVFGKERLGVNIVPNLENIFNDKEKFDAIVTFHTLEHLSSLSTIFKGFNKLLKNDGVLIIEVPFIEIDKEKAGAFKIMGAIHPLGFTPDFFINNLSKEGFAVDLYQIPKERYAKNNDKMSHTILLCKKQR